ncbi:hypothetical protein TSUD_358330 [Trifolium subterraneum]|uniref:RING-CH-type domain-containing protein n=1 Tax=Trifolium subterraneum TaxID=3900 RepID=A0A2Z6MK60_TRISU|nr:hypothetical protein TSUD_358330 [Trifolium subterraneum]
MPECHTTPWVAIITASIVVLDRMATYAHVIGFEDEANLHKEKDNDFIAPSKYVHQVCLDHWLSVKKGFIVKLTMLRKSASMVQV